MPRTICMSINTQRMREETDWRNRTTRRYQSKA